MTQKNILLMKNYTNSITDLTRNKCVLGKEKMIIVNRGLGR